MTSRLDLLIAVIGIVVSVVGSSTAMWMTIAKKADKEDLIRLETKMESAFARLDTKIDGVESRLDSRMDRLDARMDRFETKFDTRFDRVEGKLDAVILRFLPETGT